MSETSVVLCAHPVLEWDGTPGQQRALYGHKQQPIKGSSTSDKPTGWCQTRQFTRLGVGRNTPLSLDLCRSAPARRTSSPARGHQSPRTPTARGGCAAASPPACVGSAAWPRQVAVLSHLGYIHLLARVVRGGLPVRLGLGRWRRAVHPGGRGGGVRRASGGGWFAMRRRL